MLKVHCGTVLVNNIHPVPVGSTHSIVTNTCECLPLISCNQNEDYVSELSQLMPDFDAVIELMNHDEGLSSIGDYYPPLEEHFYRKESQYTFQLVHDNSEMCVPVTSIYLNHLTHRNLALVSKDFQVAVVFGAPTSGKTVIARTILNNALFFTSGEVAYLDLDVELTSLEVPGCLSLTIHQTPIYGSFVPSKRSANPDDLHCYWGFEAFLEMPHRYLSICKRLISHYYVKLKARDIPLVVRFPSFIKGYGKQLLLKLTKALKPDHFIYLSHKNAVELNGFVAEAFEAEDNPDSEVIAEFKELANVTSLRGTRRAPEVSKRELHVRNKLLYFHQTSNNTFHFQSLLFNSPRTLPFDHALAFSVLNYNVDDASLYERIDYLAEASVMGIFFYDGSEIPARGLYLNGSDFLKLETHFICLCMVHSIDHKHRHFNIYLPHLDQALNIEKALHEDSKLLLARGEGKVPPVDMIPPSIDALIPYVDSAAKKKIGGVWKPRRGISRKNQG